MLEIKVVIFKKLDKLFIFNLLLFFYFEFRKDFYLGDGGWNQPLIFLERLALAKCCTAEWSEVALGSSDQLQKKIYNIYIYIYIID